MAPKAKSRFSNKLLIIPLIVGLGVIGFYAFPLIQGLSEVNPPIPENFEIEFVDDPTTNEMIIEETENLPPIIYTDEEIEDIANNEVEPPPDETGEMIEELEMEIIEPPPPTNQTESSEDPPLEQSCDLNPESPLCEVITPPDTLQLKSIVTKTDSAGNITVEEEIFDLTLEIFVEEETDIDYRNGFLTTELNLIGKPNTSFVGDGSFDIIIGTNSILSQPLPIRINQVSDENGIIQVLFVSPTGATSPDFRFSFADNFNSFTNEAITQIKLRVSDLIVTDQDEQQFSLDEQDIFTMDIFRDDIKILIEDEEGITQRVFPSDSRIIIKTVGSGVNAQGCRIFYTMSGQGGGHTFSVRIPLSVNLVGASFPTDCIKEGVSFSRVQDGVRTIYTLNAEQAEQYTWNYPLSGVAPIPLSDITLRDMNGNLMAQGMGGASGIVFDTGNILLRDQNYTLRIGSPSMTAIIDFGKNQETKTYTCTSKVGTISYGLTSGSDTQASIRSFYEWSWHDLNPLQPSASGTTCNFP